MTPTRLLAAAFVAFLVSGCTSDAWRKSAESWCRSAPNCDLRDLNSGDAQSQRR